MLRDYEVVLKAAADPNRARVLKMLEGGELCVCQIVAVLGLSESTVSKHLSLLRGAGLVEERKRGRWAHCRLADSRANEYAKPVLSLVRRWLRDEPVVRTDAERVARIRQIPVEELCSLSPSALGRKLAAAAAKGASRG